MTRNSKAKFVIVELQVGKVRMKAKVTDPKTLALLRQVFRRLLALGALHEVHRR